MKTEKEIKNEMKKHKKYLEATDFKDRTLEQKLHSAIVEALEWVLLEEKGGGENEKI